jgi:hypothetical protein
MIANPVDSNSYLFLIYFYDRTEFFGWTSIEINAYFFLLTEFFWTAELYYYVFRCVLQQIIHKFFYLSVKTFYRNKTEK